MFQKAANNKKLDKSHFTSLAAVNKLSVSSHASTFILSFAKIYISIENF